MKKHTIRMLSAAIFFYASIYLAGCKKEEYTATTTDDVNIVGYLERYPDSFSLFKQILDRTENSAFLNAYGSYTCFAPTNSGVKTWLTSVSAASVEAADINMLKELVKFHLLTDTITTGAFKDGKLPVPTMQGQFLITGVAFSETASYTVNRQASVIKSNIKVGNGIIHEINQVMVPAGLTIAQQLEADPAYSIFVQALKETGFYTILNTVDADSSKRFKTVIAESNQILKDSANFLSYTELKARYSNTGNPANPADSLYKYIAYHIVNGLEYLGDIISQASHATLEPQEVISTQLINQDVLVNEDVFDGVREKGVKLIRNLSDNSATNGVWHSALGHFQVKIRKPAPVYWDLCAFPEIMKQPAYYKKQSFNFVRASETDKPVKDIDWEFKPNANTLVYSYSSTSSLSNQAVNYDVLVLPLGRPNRASWFNFTTPVIIKGRYKIWICYNARNNVVINVLLDGELMQRPVNLSQFSPAGTNAERESLGWKQYTAASTNGYCQSRLVGTVDIKTTDRHVLRFETVGNGTNASNYLDMVHFIPVDMDQIFPRFNPDGSKVYQ